jgi:hypothetical protein
VPGCVGEQCCTLVGEQSDPPVCPWPEQQCITGDDPVPVLVSPYDICFCGVV